MYEIGDLIVKENTGVCKVVNIVNLDMSEIDRNKLYYQLTPLEDEKAKIYVSTENACLTTRKIMTMEEAIDLIEHVADVEILAITNDKLREQKYKEIIKSNNPKELIRIIKTTYLRSKERLVKGMKNTVADKKYLGLAEKLLFSELRVVLGKDNEEVYALIKKSVEKSNNSRMHPTGISAVNSLTTTKLLN